MINPKLTKKANAHQVEKAPQKPVNSKKACLIASLPKND